MALREDAKTSSSATGVICLHLFIESLTFLSFPVCFSLPLSGYFNYLVERAKIKIKRNSNRKPANSLTLNGRGTTNYPENGHTKCAEQGETLGDTGRHSPSATCTVGQWQGKAEEKEAGFPSVPINMSPSNLLVRCLRCRDFLAFH